MLHTTKNILRIGKRADEAQRALIMLHGRGSDAADIITLSSELLLEGFCVLAPQATNNTWYPNTFLAPVEQNEPWLSSAIDLIREITDDLQKTGIPSEQIYFLGFSQGACLTLEYIARNARHWGGVIAFSGGLIGDRINEQIYQGRLSGTRIFIGNSDVDPHIPLKRCEDSAELLTKLGADVKLGIYPGMGHSINRQEIDEANSILSQ